MLLNIFLLEIMQDVRRMKTSPLTTEEIQYNIPRGGYIYFCSLSFVPSWIAICLPFPSFHAVDAGAQDIQN